MRPRSLAPACRARPQLAGPSRLRQVDGTKGPRLESSKEPQPRAAARHQGRWSTAPAPSPRPTPHLEGQALHRRKGNLSLKYNVRLRTHWYFYNFASSNGLSSDLLTLAQNLCFSTNVPKSQGQGDSAAGMLPHHSRFRETYSSSRSSLAASAFQWWKRNPPRHFFRGELGRFLGFEHPFLC